MLLLSGIWTNCYFPQSTMSIDNTFKESLQLICNMSVDVGVFCVLFWQMLGHVCDFTNILFRPFHILVFYFPYILCLVVTCLIALHFEQVLDEADRLLNEDFEKEFNEDSFLVSGEHFFFQLQGQTRYICRFVNKSELHILFIVSHFFPLSSSQILYLTVQLKLFSLQIIPNILYCVIIIHFLCIAYRKNCTLVISGS